MGQVEGGRVRGAGGKEPLGGLGFRGFPPSGQVCNKPPDQTPRAQMKRLCFPLDTRSHRMKDTDSRKGDTYFRPFFIH